MTYHNGDRYEGEWLNDLKNGEGKVFCLCIGIMSYNNGDEYNGHWKDNKKDGRGKNKWIKGRINALCK